MGKDLNIQEQKKLIRQKIKALKANIPFEEKKERSNKILTELEKNQVFINSKTIMMYWSMADEVHTHNFIEKWSATKKIILPSVFGETLKLKEFNGMSKMMEGENYQIPEPEGQYFNDWNDIQLIIVPGIAFDHQNNRLGRGKAFYDKFLKEVNAYKIGLCFDFQIVKEIPFDENDIKMDIIISEN